jgi:hypothetical protein
MTQRLTEAILGKDIAFAQGRQNTMLDLRHGGQMGYAPQLNQIISNQPYISRPLIALLIEAPLGFNDLPNPEFWIGTLRSLVELRAIKITGLSSGLDVTVEDTSPVGGAGEMHQDFTNVTRERSNPQFTWQEAYGLPVKAFLEGWVTNLMMDPNSKVANVSTLLEAGARPNAMLADYYGMTVAFIEPDPTHTKVVKAWLCTNMFPSGKLATVEGQRDLTAAGQQLQYDITFTAITQVGLGVDYYCQQLLENINIMGANPMARQAFTQYDTNNGGLGEGTLVEARLQDTGFGYKEVTENLPNSNIQLG